MSTLSGSSLPTLDYDAWEDTKHHLHLICQIIGKTRLRAHPKLNHWWHVPLYLTPDGLTTGNIPQAHGSFDIELDLRRHEIRLRSSVGERDAFTIPGRTVADTFARLGAGLKHIGVPVEILAKPYEHPTSQIPFADDTDARPWDRDAVERFHRALLFTDRAFREFAGWSYAKTTPVQLYWHSFDLAVTRFSGREAPPREGTRSDKEAYSHEVISFGFWPGDPNVRFPAYYSYTAPEPPGLSGHTLEPKGSAWWQENNGSHMALLKYEDLRALEDPHAALLSFMESAYQAGCHCAEWPRESMDSRAHWQRLDAE